MTEKKINPPCTCYAHCQCECGCDHDWTNYAELAEAWDMALAHVSDLADPAYTIVKTKSVKRLVTMADLLQALQQNPFKDVYDG